MYVLKNIFLITNDNIALETVETYSIELKSSNTSTKVVLGENSAIMIIDEDARLNIFILLFFVLSVTLWKHLYHTILKTIVAGC